MDTEQMSQKVQNSSSPRAGGRARRPPTDEQLVMAAVLLNEGMRQEDVAETLGVTRRTIVRWKSKREMRLIQEAFSLRWERDLKRRVLARYGM